MARARRLIIGLGNPGPKYEATRHNAGFLVADAVAAKTGVAFDDSSGPYVLGAGSYRGTPFAVAKPMDFMNRSGTAVKKLIGRFGLEPDDVLVVYDDLALDLGQIRLRGKGGAGGHNGVQDIIDALNSANFPRLRIGIGASFPRGQQVDFVLAPFAEEERPVIEGAVEDAAEAALVFAREGLVPAMNRFNRK
ncbi:MAG: aminoacyl-tRNA hydrolase [Rhodothermales bacterium]